MRRLASLIVPIAVVASLGCVATSSSEDERPPTDATSTALITTVDLPALADTRMEESSPDTNYAAVNVWGNGTAGRRTRSLFRFDVARLPPGIRITAARLKLTIANSTVHPYEIDAVLRPWAEASATWNSCASGARWATPGAEGSSDRGTVLASFASAATGALVLPLSGAGIDVVRGWYADPSANNGMLLREASSASTDDVKVENRDSATPPRLEVTYDTALARSPFGGTARTVPGRIEAEHFDVGGENVAYHDDATGNSGSWSGRNPTDVDIEPTSDSGGGANVGWFHAGEWLEYTIRSASAATYLIEARVASPNAGKSIRFRAGGGEWTTDTAIPVTGGYQSWATTTAVPIRVPAGTSILRVSTASGGFNLNWFNLRAQPTSTPSRIKVLSWNIHQSSSAAAQGDLLAQQNAHVIFAQEVRSSYASTIVGRLGAGWQHQFYSAENGEGVAVFTRLPIVEREQYVIGPSSWGGSREAVRLLVDVDGTRVNVFGTHLDWPKAGVWGETSEHAVGRNAFFAWIDGFAGHRIFGGDFNARVDGNATQRVTMSEADARASDSCVALGNTHATCIARYPTHGTSRIDYVYRTAGLTTVTHDVVPSNGLSDHDIVVTEIDVP